MLCPDCSCEVPDEQPICQRCYRIFGEASVLADAGPSNTPTNVMVFMEELTELWSGRIEKYLQPPVGWNWYALDIEAFRQIMNGPAAWGMRLLIVDSQRQSDYVDDLSQILARHPAIVTAVIYRGVQVPMKRTLPNSVMLEQPDDIDWWLPMMYQLMKLSGIKT